MQKQDYFFTDNPRDSVELSLDDGRVITGPRNGRLEAFAKVAQKEQEAMIVGVVLDGVLRELTYKLERDGKGSFITMADEDGARIYRRSLTFLLELAFKRCFANGLLTIDYSVSSGGYYCQVDNLPEFGPENLAKLEATMHQLVEEDLPFVRDTVPLEEAVAYFTECGEEDKVRLLKYRNRPDLVLYSLGEVRDYHHGYMVPSTGYLKWFALEWVGDAFIMHFPRRHKPNGLSPMTKYPKLLKAFQDYGEWLSKLGIPSVGALNDAIQMGHIDEVILVSEALHEMQISNIADQIQERHDKAGLVLIAGPSSSGKTTFSKRLGIQLLARGITPFALEMDNFFIDREKTPLTPEGEKDFESLRALDLKRLNKDLRALLTGKKVQLPRYDFLSGLSVDGETAQLKKDDIIILEGIHGMNPDLLEGIGAEETFKIYVSCLTQLNLDRHNRISTTDTRLLRRILRDSRDRGYSAEETISRWEQVRKGETQYIFPYQENADAVFNSALAYELSALKPLVEPLLRQVRFGTREHIEAKRLLKFLEWFLPISIEYVPSNSLLREFTGDSLLTNFSVWEH